jgi:hypothetical protein
MLASMAKHEVEPVELSELDLGNEQVGEVAGKQGGPVVEAAGKRHLMTGIL